MIETLDPTETLKGAARVAATDDIDSKFAGLRHSQDFGVQDAAHDLLLSESLLVHTIMLNNQDTIYFKDLQSRYVLNSRAHANQFGLPDASLMRGKTDFDFFPREFAERAFREEQKMIKTGEPIINNIEKWEREDGVCIWFSACKYPLIDQSGTIVGTWGTSRDITELKRAEESLAAANEELKKLSLMDELSGLYNRRHFYEMLGRAVHRYGKRQLSGREETFSIIVLDIDRFKTINDSLGHATGDDAIRHVADLLKKTCRPTDTAFRVGGDEFVVILLDTDLFAARRQAERIRSTAENSPLTKNSRSYPLTLSIGVASFDEHSDSNEFVHAADSRLYRSKSLGRNRVT